jgi:hypothetical protein
LALRAETVPDADEYSGRIKSDEAVSGDAFGFRGRSLASSVIPACLGPRTLRHLAGALVPRAMVLEDRELRPRRELSDAAIESLASLLAKGRSPTIDWWKRWGTRSSPSALARSDSGVMPNNSEELAA